MLTQHLRFGKLLGLYSRPYFLFIRLGPNIFSLKLHGIVVEANPFIRMQILLFLDPKVHFHM